MLAEFKAVSSRVLKAGIIALAKAGDKFQDKLAVSVMHLLRHSSHVKSQRVSQTLHVGPLSDT